MAPYTTLVPSRSIVAQKSSELSGFLPVLVGRRRHLGPLHLCCGPCFLSHLHAQYRHRQTSQRAHLPVHGQCDSGQVEDGIQGVSRFLPWVQCSGNPPLRTKRLSGTLFDPALLPPFYVPTARCAGSPSSTRRWSRTRRPASRTPLSRGLRSGPPPRGAGP